MSQKSRNGVNSIERTVTYDYLDQMSCAKILFGPFVGKTHFNSSAYKCRAQRTRFSSGRILAFLRAFSVDVFQTVPDGLEIRPTVWLQFRHSG